MRHLSIRVPWHDAGWTGTICDAPLDNDACLALPRIRQTRRDEEQFDAGADWSDLPDERLPPCVRERAGFMRDSELHVQITHPYQRYSGAHEGLEPLSLRMPDHSAPCIPFRWLLRRYAPAIAEREGVDYSDELERDADRLVTFRSGWVQHGDNQRALVERFFSLVEEQRSLCFLYAKRVPLLDDDRERRILIGVGRVVGVVPPQRFDGQNPLDTIAWESAVRHSIRPQGDDGFLLPYREALAHRRHEPRFDPADIVAFAPEDGHQQFSYASEHVSHDVAIGSLLACAAALRAAETALPGSRTSELRWIDARLGELWRLRGPCPGIATALDAFGVPQSTLAMRELAPLLTENEDPWELVGRAMMDPDSLLDGLGRHFIPSVREKWSVLPDERRALLQLVSRFELTPEQARRWFQPAEREAAGIALSDADVLANPYLLYEQDRAQADPIPVMTIDHGAFPERRIREAHPLPSPSALADGLDARRARALLTRELDRAGESGDTLRPEADLIRAVSALALDPPCPLDADQLAAYGDRLQPLLTRTELKDGTPALQLREAAEDAAVIRRFVTRRVDSGARKRPPADWGGLLREALGEADASDPDEARARAEKAAALDELYASRFSVLVGAAGTGKTTLLRALCAEPAVAAGGVLLLAPTGKARVRLKQSVGLGLEAMTVAQFLLGLARYDPETSRYRRSTADREGRFATVIVDEASMLTEPQLAALIDGLGGVDRFILVGDWRQLPPIGAGRPFIDVVRKLTPLQSEAGFPRVARGYAELLVPRRQLVVDGRPGGAAQLRDDLTLAEWFGARALSPGADEVWDQLAGGATDSSLRVVRWEDGKELSDLLLDLLAEDLGLAGEDEQRAFELACGGSVPHEDSEHVYFRRTKDGQPGPAARVDDWQVLTPARAHAHGVHELNRAIQRRFRARTREWAIERQRRIPKPAGPEEILYGDRVISTRNDTRRKVHPKDGAERYVANGDIGVVVGTYLPWGASWSGPLPIQVEYGSQTSYTYEYRRGELRDDDPPLELAYALTVHRAQGSEFGRTFLVVPRTGRQLSRELLYTAFTRQREHVTVLCQGDPIELKELADPIRSETAGRLTNLFDAPDPLRSGDGFVERSLLHVTASGAVVRAESERRIADVLTRCDVAFAYERRLAFADGTSRYPAFTIVDDDAGITIYWEHLPSLDDSKHARRWERKRAWYAEHGVHEASEEQPQGGPAGLLVWTVDRERGGLDEDAVAALVERLFG